MKQNVRGVLAYIFGLSLIGPAVVLYAYKDNDSRTKFNCYQAMTAAIINIIAAVAIGILSAILSDFASVIGFARTIISLLLFACMIIGAVKAYKEEDCELPVISDLTRNIFKSKLD